MNTTSFFSMLFLFSLLLVTTSDAAIQCGTVITKAAPCILFASGRTSSPGPQCCGGLRDLVRATRTTYDKRAVCRCLKASARSTGVQDRFLRRIPGACSINVGFPISLATNCEAIH